MENTKVPIISSGDGFEDEHNLVIGSMALSDSVIKYFADCFGADMNIKLETQFQDGKLISVQLVPIVE